MPPKNSARKEIPTQTSGSTDANVKAPAKKKTIRNFTELPTEIRNMIYRFVVVPNSAIKSILMKSSDSPGKEKTIRSFMTLPPEIRNMIYKFVVIPTPKGFYVRADVLAFDRTPTIAQTCRQTRKEALAIYYGHNTFRVHIYTLSHLQPFYDWLKAIGPDYSKIIRQINIEIPGYGWANIRHFLEVKESLLAPDVNVEFEIDNLYLEDSWRKALTVGSELRIAGLSWDQIQRTLGLINSIMDNTAFCGEWPDPRSPWMNPYFDSDDESD